MMLFCRAEAEERHNQCRQERWVAGLMLPGPQCSRWQQGAGYGASPQMAAQPLLHAMSVDASAVTSTHISSYHHITQVPGLTTAVHDAHAKGEAGHQKGAVVAGEEELEVTLQATTMRVSRA